ncbi:MAG: RnfABCDGE type electron transport complex subunit G [Porphyromonadaceae bacterium]|nr:RnfABCDGE type electron transport complex subunit G [Porphyromonadaceae bacterium]
MARKSSFGNMVVVLTLITLIAGVLLGYVQKVTHDPIEKAQKAKQEDAVKQVVPEFDNAPIAEQYTVEANGLVLKLFPATKDGERVGTAVETVSKKGFGGEISIMVGFNADGSIRNYQVLSHNETPGLGSKMGEWFKTDKGAQSVLGKNPGVDNLTVKKDGGDVDAITAATISSRAFLDAIANAYAAYTNNTDAITGATTQKGKEENHE